jgi:hypothetical protein
MGSGYLIAGIAQVLNFATSRMAAKGQQGPSPVAIRGLPKRVGSGRGPLNERPVWEGAVTLVNDVRGREAD